MPVRPKFVAITRDGANAQLAVKDNGSGFDYNAEGERSGLGLAGMKERIKMANGRLSIASHPGYGTEIIASVPLTGGTK
jgi:signal transduction histidine kinase